MSSIAAFNLAIGKTKHLEIMTKMREMKAMTMMVGWCSLSHAFGRKVKREEKHFCMYVAHWCYKLMDGRQDGWMDESPGL